MIYKKFKVDRMCFMKKVGWSILIIVLVFMVGGLIYGVRYLFNYAIVSGDKDFIKKDNVVQLEKEWEFAPYETVSLVSRDDLKLKARMIRHPEKTSKVAVLAHGYMGQAAQMGEYAHYFYELGYDVLVPDNRAHGKSDGKYVGFGWLDRLDYVDWINQINELYEEEANIVLFGISMGAATVMMTSGEPLPPQVQAVIADCGYDTVENELRYQLKQMFNLPAFPLVPLTSLYTQYKVGYGFKEASAIKQLEKNKLPLLIIHGDQDDFVPTSMTEKLYQATKGPKELVIIKGAKHAESWDVDNEQYKQVVRQFLERHENTLEATH